MRKSKFILSILLSAGIILPILSVGCADSAFIKARDGQLKVIASIYPMADFATKIGGEHVFVVQLIPSGFEPHAWEPSTLDMSAFEEADVFIYNGAGMEVWSDKVLTAVQNQSLISVNTSADVDLIEPGAYSVTEDSREDDSSESYEDDHNSDASSGEEHDEEDHDHGTYDPHVWLDPRNAKLQMKAICETLCRADPEHEEYYRDNFVRYAAEADALDKKYRDALEGAAGDYIVVSHEAFGYLCKAYGLWQIPIRGISADAEPDAARMREIIEMTEKYHVRVIFFEALSSPKVAEVIAEETGCETLPLHPIGGLTEEQIEAGEDYFSLMRSNLEALTYALS